MANSFRYVSEPDVDYSNLTYLLKNQRWQEANEETLLKLLEASGRLVSLARSTQLLRQDISILRLLNPTSQRKLLDALLQSGQLTHKEIQLVLQSPEMIQPPSRQDRQVLIHGWQARGWHLTVHDLELFPCADLQTIDRLWGKYSSDWFGFSAQWRIWQQLGGNSSAMESFGRRVGWRNSNAWIDYSAAKFTLQAPEGHLPIVPLVGWWCWVKGLQTIFDRLQACKVPTHGSALSTSQGRINKLPVVSPRQAVIDVIANSEQ